MTPSLDFLRFRRSIRDPLHGTITVSDEEIAIVDDPLFRRLHNIRQNGLLHYVFPSASHTRFEHSLGVVHVATSIFWALIQNSYTSKSKSAVVGLDRAKTSEAIEFHSLDNALLTDLLRLLRIAALVHDLGHGPFSHHFDAFAPLSRDVARLVRLTSGLHLSEDFIQSLEAHGETGIEHEQMSCIFFAEICRKAESRFDSGNHFTPNQLPKLISAIILGKPSDLPEHPLNPYLKLLHDLVASAPIDADRMDYLERDSRSVGVSYGLYDKERVLKSFLVYKDGDELRLGIKLSGLRAVENFVQARFELFVQVYYHKTNRATQLMLSEIAETAKKRKLRLVAASDLHQLVQTYVTLSDESFLSILRGGPSEIFSGEIPKEIKTLADRLAERHLWKRVTEGTKKETRAVLNSVKGKHAAEVRLDNVDPKATKDLSKGARILKRSSSGVYKADSSVNWTGTSPMIRVLAAEERNISRLYYTGMNSAALKKLREHARKLPNANTDR